jgi:hypothetical protein
VSFLLQYKGDDGRTVDVVPTAVRPLGLNELRILSSDPTATLVLEVVGQDPVIDGTQRPGTATVAARMTFREAVPIYALVPGGWLPPPFVLSGRYMLDRNAVANFRKLRLNQGLNLRDAFELWTSFFEQGAALFNTLPHAFEGSLRREQCFDEFVNAFEAGAYEVEQTFPKSKVIRLSDDQYRLAYGEGQRLYANCGREIEFVCQVNPLLVEATATQSLPSVRDRILATAHRIGVDRQSLAVLVALSCLYEDPGSSQKSIGRKILKPRREYTSSDAYNAVNDLRHIELAAFAHAYVAGEPFAFCTCDKAVALLWCALGIRDVTQTPEGTEYVYDFGVDMFPRLRDEGVGEIASLLASS